MIFKRSIGLLRRDRVKFDFPLDRTSCDFFRFNLVSPKRRVTAYKLLDRTSYDSNRLSLIPPKRRVILNFSLDRTSFFIFDSSVFYGLLDLDLGTVPPFLNCQTLVCFLFTSSLHLYNSTCELICKFTFCTKFSVIFLLF